MKQLIKLENYSMVIDTASQTFDMKQIRNRRFMYSGVHHTLILGDSAAGIKIGGSHAEEFHLSGAPGKFDDYIRGWIGRNSTDYKKGIIHFAPQILAGKVNEGLSFLYWITDVKGIEHNTRVRGFINVTECDLVKIIPSKFKKITL